MFDKYGSPALIIFVVIVVLLSVLLFVAAGITADLKRDLNRCRASLDYCYEYCGSPPICVDNASTVNFVCEREDCKCVFEFIGKDGE